MSLITVKNPEGGVKHIAEADYNPKEHDIVLHDVEGSKTPASYGSGKKAKAEKSEGGSEAVDFGKMNKEALVAHAEKEGIDIKGLSTVKDIRGAIEAAIAAKK